MEDPDESGFPVGAGLSPSMFSGRGALQRAGSWLGGDLDLVLRASGLRRGDRK